MLSQQTPQFKVKWLKISKTYRPEFSFHLLKIKYTSNNHKSFQQTFVLIIGAS